jgi:hypothetical protein
MSYGLYDELPPLSKATLFTSEKHLVYLWASLASFQRCKDAKDVKMPHLWKVGYLVSKRHNMSFKDGEHLLKPCLSLSKDHLCIVAYIFYVFCIFQ